MPDPQRSLHDELGEAYADLTWNELEAQAARLLEERDVYRASQITTERAYHEAIKANATYKHLARAARLLVDGFDSEDQEAIDSGLAGLREIFNAWDAD